MFTRLKEKWKVTWLEFVLIFCTFAIGGSLCGYVGRKILGLINLDKTFLYYFTYILLITILWPFAVLIISIPFGQYSFFRKYIRKMGNRIFGNKK